MILTIKFYEKDKYYVIERTVKNGELIKQSQYVKIDGFRRQHAKKEVSYNFHLELRYHEGFTNKEKLKTYRRGTKIN